MKPIRRSVWLATAAVLVAAMLPAWAQRWSDEDEETAIVARFDKDGDGRLNARERAAALAAWERGEWSSGRGGGFGRRGFGRSATSAASYVRKYTPGQVKRYGNEPLFDPQVLRTLFLQFEDSNWEYEMVAFKGTDVKVPATVTVDGKVYREVGVHFRGQTSFMDTSDGEKRSLNLSFDDVVDKQNLLGYRGLSLLNAAGDPTFLRNVLYMQIARSYFPAPKGNFVRVVINGESWGIYVNQQQFNSDFTRESGGLKGPRWKVPGSPRGRGGFEYFGDDPAPYKSIYQIKSADKPESWAALIKVFKVLNQTPPDRLDAALEPLLDVDGTLRFLALDNAMVNGDGFWTRASDYSIYQDSKGRMHVTPHDANEVMRPIEMMGFGRRGGLDNGAPPGTIALDPLVDQNDASKPLLSRLLAVPALRKRYLGYVRDINDRWLSWRAIEPLARQYQALIRDDVQLDAHKLFPFGDFSRALDGDGGAQERGGMTASPDISLKDFLEQRHAWLANWFAKSR